MRETTRQHAAQCGTARYGAFGGGRLVSVRNVCSRRLAHGVVESCPLLHMPACAGPLANFIIHVHTYTLVTGN